MNPSTAINIESLIQVVYPGGMYEFIKNGSLIFGFPDTDHFLIYCPTMSQEGCKKVRDGASTFGATVEFIGTLNFHSAAELKAWTVILGEALASYGLSRSIPTVDPCTVYIQVAYVSTCPAVQRLIRFLRRSEIICRAHIKCKDTLVVIDQPRKVDLKEVPEKESIKKEIQIERHAITNDDITNLRIELETCKDAQEFIDSI